MNYSNMPPPPPPPPLSEGESGVETNQETPFLPVLHDDLMNLASVLIAEGVRLIPIGRNKRPLWRVLPLVERKQKDGTTKKVPSWKALMNEGPTTLSQVEFWLNCGAAGLAAACGHTWSNGLYVFDIDEPDFFDKWIKGDVAAIFENSHAACQKTGGGGFQIAVMVDGETPKNSKLAWAIDEEALSGRSIAIETRGEGGYIVLPFSVHPSGNYYLPTADFGGDFEGVGIGNDQLRP